MNLPHPNHRAIEAWLGQLPLVNTRYCSTRLLEVLDAFNRDTSLTPALRVELTELLRPTAMVVQWAELHHGVDAPLPYPAETEAEIGQGLALNAVLADSYRIAGFDSRGFDAPAKEDEKLAHALYRSLQHCGLNLLWICQLYQAPGLDWWDSVYAIYRLAAERNILRVRIHDAEESEPCQTIIGLFKRSILFYLANPRQLRQRDQRLVFRLLGMLGDYASVRDPAGVAGPPADFVVDLSGNQPPARGRDASGEASGDGQLALYTKDLAKMMLKAIRQDQAEGRKEAGDQAALMRVVKTLGTEGKRRWTRRTEALECQFVVGLRAIIDVLSPKAAKKPEPIAKRPFMASGTRFELLPNLDDSSAPLSEGRVLRSEVGLTLGDQDIRPPSRARPSRGAGQTEFWYPSAEPGARTSDGGSGSGSAQGHIVNSSPQGFYVVLPADRGTPIRVGELIGIWEGDALLIGTICWLAAEDVGLQFGVELFAPLAKPVEIRSGASLPLKAKIEGLLLPADRVLRPSPELLAFPGTFVDQSTLVLGVGSELKAYSVAKVLPGTPSFARAELAEVADKVQPERR